MIYSDILLQLVVQKGYHSKLCHFFLVVACCVVFALCLLTGERCQMSSGSRASKRPRYDNGSDIGSAAEEAPLNLLALLQSDIGSKILSYASSVELCTLDILNKQFNALTTNQWNKITKDRFGMFNGKEDWKVGTSFLRPARFIHNVVGDYGIVNDACSQIAANESISRRARR